VLWHKRIGTGYSAPSVLGTQVVIHHRIGNEEIVEALDPGSGKTLWRHAYPSKFVDPYGYNNGPRASPTLASNRCFTFGAEGKLLCLNLENGKVIWQRNTSEEWNVPPAFFGVGSSPVLEGGRLFVMIGGQPASGVVAFHPETGKTLWESVGQKNWEGLPMAGWPGEPRVIWKEWEKQASYSTPVPATIHGKRQLLCLMRQGLVSLDPANGHVNYSFWFRARVDDSVNALNPVVADDLVFISAAYYRVGSVLLKIASDGRQVTPVWRSPVLEIHWSTPIYYQGYLYAFSGRNEPDARFRCVELKTGNLLWDRDESWQHNTSTPATYGRGSAILSEGKLIALGEGGLLGLFKVTPKEPEEISRFQVPQLHYPCWAAPVLANRRLYLRSEDHLICFNLAAASK